MTDSGTLTRDKPAGRGGRSPEADPPVAVPAGAAMSGQDVLLATKLHVPGPRPGFAPRPRLVKALGEGLARGRVLVCAPAGFGKTALLADWARGSGRPVAWLGLDGGDSDPAPRQALSQRLHQTRARHKTRLRPWHMQLGRQQDILPGHPGPRRWRHRRVSHR